jgi:hypothetical protein
MLVSTFNGKHILQLLREMGSGLDTVSIKSTIRLTRRGCRLKKNTQTVFRLKKLKELHYGSANKLIIYQSWNNLEQNIQMYQFSDQSSRNGGNVIYL